MQNAKALLNTIKISDRKQSDTWIRSPFRER